MKICIEPWEVNEDILTIDGMPVGRTISRCGRFEARQVAAEVERHVNAEIAALRRALAYWPPCNCNQPESIADFSGEPQKQCPRCSLPADVQEIVNCATKTTNERTNP